MKDMTNTLLYYITYTPFLIISMIFLNLVLFVSVVIPSALPINMRRKRSPLPNLQEGMNSLDNLYWIETPKADCAANDISTIPSPAFSSCEAGYNCKAATPNIP
jgi:hypothetical protein